MSEQGSIMDLYNTTSYELSRALTLRYSTSFSRSTKLFPAHLQRHIFAIYGLVRIADETVDTYTGDDRAEVLEALRTETYAALESGYSTNPIVHAFALTARQFKIDALLIEPFFESMRMDLTPKAYTKSLYETYIYGSAEVIGLMCLRVFVGGNEKEYDKLEAGARALGAAYQKVNFLRDIASDYNERGRVYFPGVAYETMTSDDKEAIERDIQRDFEIARQYIKRLPNNAHSAVQLSYVYYTKLLEKITETSLETLKQRRVRISNATKLRLMGSQIVFKKGTRSSL